MEDYDKRTPLHIAVCNENADAIKFLIDNNGQSDIKDRWGKTPLDYAKHKSKDIINLLTNIEMDTEESESNLIDKIDKQKSAAKEFKLLLESVTNRDKTEVKLLLQKKCDVNAGDYDKRTPLHISASNN